MRLDQGAFLFLPAPGCAIIVSNSGRRNHGRRAGQNQDRLALRADEAVPDIDLDVSRLPARPRSRKHTCERGHRSRSDDNFCEAAFDLSCAVPDGVVSEARASGRLVFIDTPEGAVRVLDSRLAGGGAASPVRICVPGLGSPWWGDVGSKDILRFLHSLRGILRRHPHACASVCLAPHLSADKVLLERAGWMCDAALSLSAFTADPALSATFPSYHGLVTIHTLPAPHTVLPPSDKHSTLRGAGVSGENNLAFKCTRKRMLFETLHLDIEGGVGERRTTSAPATMASMDAGETHSRAPQVSEREMGGEARQGLAAVEVQLEVETGKPKKAKKKVGFSSDW